jgi:hypothetical protein
MPDLNIRFLNSKKLLTSSELIISDVCSECNNGNLSMLDDYFCSMFDKYFKFFVEEKSIRSFTYDYNLLTRSILKILYNSSRTTKRLDNELYRYRNYILNGSEIREDFIIKIDLVTPYKKSGVVMYPRSVRCGQFEIDKKTDNFILKVLSVNSFYFYIVISRDEVIVDESIENEYIEISASIPGTILHPYKNEIILSKFSTENAFSIHHDHFNTNEKAYEAFLNRNSDNNNELIDT